jgi:spermidine/putrescine transport system permease protein
VELPKGRARRGSRSLPYVLLSPGMLWLVIFFLVPMATLAALSLQTGDYEQGFTLTWNWHIYSEMWTRYGHHFIRSFSYAFVATVAALVIAYPLAYAIAFKAGRWKNLLLVLVIAPFFTSFLVRTLAWQAILADNGWVTSTLRSLHFPMQDGRLLNTSFAVICGLTYNFLPFMVLPLYASLERIDPRVVEAASDLYARPITAFRRVTFPLSLPGVVAGTLLTFIPAAGDYVNATFLGSPQDQMVGNVVDKQFLVSNDYPIASALSMTMLVAILILVSLYIRRAGTEEIV